MGTWCGDGHVEYQRLASLRIDAEHDPTPLWWKDGSRIAVAMPPEGIYIVDVRGSDVSIFPPGSPVGNCKDQGTFSPALSPDGSRLAYVVAKRDGRSEIVTSAIDGSDVRRLTKDKGVHMHPTWSSDGTQIAFMSGSRARHKDLYVMDADGSNVRMIAVRNTTAHPPAWSPDGSRIAFVDRPDRRSPVRIVYTVRPDGSDLVELGATLSDPVWSPDGSRLAFIAEGLQHEAATKWDAPPKNRLVVVNPDGSDRGDWPPTLGGRGSASFWITALSWSPDGSKIVYGTGSDFRIVAADGTGTPVEVWGERGEDRRTAGGAAWSPDGSTIAFYSHHVLFTTADTTAAGPTSGYWQELPVDRRPGAKAADSIAR